MTIDTFFPYSSTVTTWLLYLKKIIKLKIKFNINKNNTLFICTLHNSQ